MKKTLLSLGAVALLLASCDPNTKDSYQTLTYPEYNLIVDTQDMDADAQASYGDYQVKFNISQYCVDVKASDIIINNQKYSFETDTMAVRQKYFTIDGTTSYYMMFYKNGIAGAGSAASDLTGTFVGCFVPQTNDILNPSFALAAQERLDLRYTLNGRYRVQTFWPAAYYQGRNVAVSGSDTYTSTKTGYLTQIDFEKKTASIYVYNAEFSADKENAMPKVMRFEGIPVVFDHYGFRLESAAPKTQVLGIKDNRTALVDSVGFEAKDFTLELTSDDLTDVMISYKLKGNQINFQGTSILKPTN